MLGSTATSSIWGQFSIRCYSSGDLSEPVCLDIIGVPGPVGPTVIDGREKLFEIFFLLA